MKAGEAAYLFENVLLGDFVHEIAELREILVGDWYHVHYGSDVEIFNPLVSVAHAEQGPLL